MKKQPMIIAACIYLAATIFVIHFMSSDNTKSDTYLQVARLTQNMPARFKTSTVQQRIYNNADTNSFTNPDPIGDPGNTSNYNANVNSNPSTPDPSSIVVPGVSLNSGDWISVVSACKQVMSVYGYSRQTYVDVTIDGVTYNARCDCSGYVGLCIKVYKNNPGLSTGNSATDWSQYGFTRFTPSSPSDLQPGDILQYEEHVQIYGQDIGNDEYLVWNRGSKDSCINPGMTTMLNNDFARIKAAYRLN